MALTIFTFQNTPYIGVPVAPYSADLISPTDGTCLVWQGHSTPESREESKLILQEPGKPTNGWVLVKAVQKAFPD